MSSLYNCRGRAARLCFLLLALSNTLIWAQDSPSQPPGQQPARSQPVPRPRIGLALSGGGARGLAHIGVLQWMEENHIPVDSIAGTSMGGLVGALYATGRSPAQMRQFVEAIHWDEAVASEPSYPQLSYRRKEDRRTDQIPAQLGLKNGLSGPLGFTAGQGVGLLLDRIAFPYSTVTSFDDLPIPFRCVATDMLSGDAVVLKDGSLAQSLRATLAIPGLFTPVELNGQVLADGGLVDNIPTDVARQMNADIVIAVNIGTPLVGRKNLESITSFLTQAVDIMTLGNDRRALRLANAQIAPDLGAFTVLDFSHADEIIRLGYQGAAKNAAELQKYALPDDQWQQYLAQREARKRKPEVSADLLQVSGVSGDEQKHLQRRLQRFLHQPLNLDQLDTRLTRITGDGQFESLGYEGFVQNGVPGLRVAATQKNYGPPFVDLAVNVDGSGVAAFDFSAGARVTFMDVEHHSGEWRNDLLLGSSNLAASEFYQPLGNTHLFVAPYAFASKLPRNEFTGETRVAVFGDERAGGGFDLGYNTGRRSELRFGYEIFSGKLAPLIGSAGLSSVSGSTGEFRTRYVWDGQDSPAVPSRGTRLVASLSRVLQSPGLIHPIDQLDVQTSTFIPTGPKTSLFLVASGGTTFHGAAGPFQVFTLGGAFHLGAYLPQEFVGNHYAYSSLGFRREFYHLPQLVGGKIYWGGWYEAGSAFNDPNTIVVRGTFNLGVIAETIVGPIALAGSVSPTGESRVNFSIGRLF
ncbi:MAG TPA: patatin-like phospholipase family protein [Candidatus Sulfotelmatobacter sp.]|jgi:NTE family protein|nr:patatin-like phospholipase family protein [Candidatus Sulfotelmatobacter sp.]